MLDGEKQPRFSNAFVDRWWVLFSIGHRLHLGHVHADDLDHETYEGVCVVLHEHRAAIEHRLDLERRKREFFDNVRKGIVDVG